MKLFCCTCNTDMEVRLTSGEEVYPHREDLHQLPFWMCSCGSFVGCHHKSKTPTKPLGVIPSPEIKRMRMKIHNMLDPIWRSGRRTRSEIYTELSNHFGKKYHTAYLRSVHECELVLEYLTVNYGWK